MERLRVKFVKASSEKPMLQIFKTEFSLNVMQSLILDD